MIFLITTTVIGMKRVNKIIVEGYDNSGKSTLIHELQKHFGFDTHWAGGPPPSPSHAVVDATSQLAMIDTIHDRFTAISRVCYEDPSLLVPFELSVMKNVLRRADNSKRCVIIYCIGQGGEEQMSICDNPEHREYLASNGDTIRSRYLALMRDIKHFQYDWRVHSIKDVIDYIGE